MKLSSLAAALALAALALAGCADDPEDAGAPTTTGPTITYGNTPSRSPTSSAPATSSSSSSTGPASAENRAPTGGLSVAINGTTATFTLTGSDPDGDTVVWDLAFGDGNATNGTTLPTTLDHAYAVGNYTATLTLTDGKDPVSYTADVALAASGPAALFTFTEAASAPGNPFISLQIPGVGWCGATCCAGYDVGMSGLDCVFTTLPDGLAGHAFTATSDVGDPDVEFWANCDATELFSVADFRNAGAETGTVPEGAACVILWDNAVPPSAPGFPVFTFTVT